MLVMALAQALKTLEKEGGFRSEQATAILEAIEVTADKTRQEPQASAHREFATKADLQELKADLVKWIFGLLVSQRSWCWAGYGSCFRRPFAKGEILVCSQPRLGHLGIAKSFCRAKPKAERRKRKQSLRLSGKIRCDRRGAEITEDS